MTRILLCAALAIVAAPQSALPADGPENLIRNAAFETDADQDGVPDGWTTSGARGVVQHITMVEGREGGKAAKLACTEFVDGSPSSHAMICQLGVVGAKRGQWYRLTFWAKGKGLKRPIVSAALRDTKTWGDSGITGSFPVSATWRRVELTFQAKQDVPAETSRLQIWFASTGELWLGDLVFARTQIRRQYQPQIAAKGVGNPIPNSSFEAGTAGWGSWSPSIRYWGGNVFRLLGEVDDTTAAHGRRSLRLRVDKGHMPTFYFDDFDPLAVPIHALTAGHKGWAPVEPGKPYVLSCSLKADAADVPAVLMVHHSPWSRVTKEVKVGPGWQRFSCPFTVQRDAVWAAVGVDLETSELDSATLWIDAVQIEPGQAPTEYAPRRPVESFIDTPALGNIFTDPAAGMTVRVVACNAGDGPERVGGQLVVTDFFGREVSRDKLDLVKTTLKMLTEELEDGDTVAIVAYAGSAGLVLEPTPMSEKDKVLKSLRRLAAGGSTAMGAGIDLAYQLADQTYAPGAVNRVIVCSDGDANVGNTHHRDLSDQIKGYAQRGITLTTVGFGEGNYNYNDTMMERLANDGDGNYYYVDSEREARRIFVDQLTSIMEVIAKDVKIQVEWHPKAVSTYRLLGYENRDIADVDFRNDKVDAGEIGAGHQVTALYEVLLAEDAEGPLATVHIRNKAPGPDSPAAERSYLLYSKALASSFAETPASYRLSVAAAAFAELLRQSPHMSDVSYSQVLTVALGAQRAEYEEDAELVELIEGAQRLSN